MLLQISSCYMKSVEATSAKRQVIFGETLFSFLPSHVNSLSTQFDASEFDPELLVSISPCLGQEKTSAEVQSGGRSGFWEN